MPTYEYACKACKNHYERFQRMMDDSDTVCPTCGDEVHRIIFPAGVIFKGSGFYATDSRKTTEPTTPATPSDGDKPSVEKAETKTESSPAPVAEKKETTATAPAA